MTTILVTGATGYIGGTILTSLLALHLSYDITVLLRPTAELTPFKRLGVSIATAETQEEVAEVAIDFDVVIHEASASNVPWIQGLITGLERRARQRSGEETRRKPLFMYGGGTGVMEDDCRGEYASDKIWSDYDYEGLEGLPASAMHREGDLLTTYAAKRGIIHVCHLSPGLVYGSGTGPVNQISKQIPSLIDIAIKRKQAVYIGKGLGIWGPVHVQDLADAFLFLLHNTLSSHKSPKIKTGWETFHSVEVPSQAENWRTISEGVGDALYEFGKVMSKGAVSVPWETDLGTAKDVLSANARSRADRLAAEGWKPRQPSMMECLRGDVKQVLEAKFGVAA